jgi:hypothetical protein
LDVEIILRSGLWPINPATTVCGVTRCIQREASATTFAQTTGFSIPSADAPHAD